METKRYFWVDTSCIGKENKGGIFFKIAEGQQIDPFTVETAKLKIKACERDNGRPCQCDMWYLANGIIPPGSQELTLEEYLR